MAGRVEGKVAIVTGGAGGIGGATSRLLAKEGAQVTIADLDGAAGRALAGEIGAVFERLDVTDEAAWKRVVSGVLDRHGKIDILVNGAGIEGDVRAGSPENTTLAEWRRVHAINLDGVFLGCREVLPAMKRQGRGSIVNISSIVSFFGTPGTSAYGSSKAGVQQFSKTVALHGSRDGTKVRCNSVHPGVIKTRMVDSIFEGFAEMVGQSPDALLQSSLRAVPFGELGAPEDVACLILFLASDESRYITGSEFQVDGGWHLVDAR